MRDQTDDGPRTRSPLRLMYAVAVAAIGFSCAFMSTITIAQPTTQQSTPPPPSRFVTRSGTNFMRDGKPFRVAGVNNHYLTTGSRAEVTAVLDDAVAMGANVVRTFIQPVIGSRDGKTSPTIWDWHSTADSSNLGPHGTYMLYWDSKRSAMVFNDGPDGLERLDFLLAEAAKRKLTLLIAFLDYWDYMGGAQQMNAWYGHAKDKSFFARDPRTIRDYKAWVDHVVSRRNSINGVIYREDPTIFGWELMNEPNIEPASLLRNWIVEMSAHVKSVDSAHLVAVGHGNLYDDFADIALPNVDFGTWHGYPIHWGVSAKAINGEITRFCGLAQKFEKPMLFEEFGLARSNRDQADVYRMWLSTIQDNPDCAGWVVWRLVSRQDHGDYPEDTYDQFDIHNDGGDTWRALSDAAAQITADE